MGIANAISFANNDRLLESVNPNRLREFFQAFLVEVDDAQEDGAALGEPDDQALVRAAAQPDFQSLTGAMEAVYSRISNLYHRIIDDPANAARKRLPDNEGQA